MIFTKKRKDMNGRLTVHGCNATSAGGYGRMTTATAIQNVKGLFTVQCRIECGQANNKMREFQSIPGTRKERQNHQEEIQV